MPNLTTLPQTAFLRLPHARVAHLTALLAVPLFSDDEMLGVLCFFRKARSGSGEIVQDPPQSDLTEIQYAATLTARVLVSQVLLKADRLSMHDYASALIQIIEASLGSLRAAPSPASLATPLSPTAAPSFPASSLSATLALDSASPRTAALQASPPPRFDVFPLLTMLGTLNRPLRWSFALHSDEHKAAIRVLSCLAFNAKLLTHRALLAPPLLHALTEALRFLNTTSPPPGPRTPVRYAHHPVYTHDAPHARDTPRGRVERSGNVTHRLLRSRRGRRRRWRSCARTRF